MRRALTVLAIVGTLTAARPTLDAHAVEVLPGVDVPPDVAPAVSRYFGDLAVAKGEAAWIDDELVLLTLDLHDWLRLAACESGRRWNIRNRPYAGGLQFVQSSWEAVGGVGSPADAPIAEQIERGRMLLDLQGPRAWPVCSRRIGWAA